MAAEVGRLEVGRHLDRREYYLTMEDHRPYKETGNIYKNRALTPFMNDELMRLTALEVGPIAKLINVAISPVFLIAGVVGLVLGFTALSLCWGIEKCVSRICTDQGKILMATRKSFNASCLTKAYGVHFVAMGVMSWASWDVAKMMVISKEKLDLQRASGDQNKAEFLNFRVRKSEIAIVGFEQKIEQDLQEIKKDQDSLKLCDQLSKGAQATSIAKVVKKDLKDKISRLQKRVSDNDKQLQDARFSVQVAKEMLVEQNTQLRQSTVTP